MYSMPKGTPLDLISQRDIVLLPSGRVGVVATLQEIKSYGMADSDLYNDKGDQLVIVHLYARSRGWNTFYPVHPDNIEIIGNLNSMGIVWPSMDMVG